MFRSMLKRFGGLAVGAVKGVTAVAIEGEEKVVKTSDTKDSIIKVRLYSPSELNNAFIEGRAAPPNYQLLKYKADYFADFADKDLTTLLGHFISEILSDYVPSLDAYRIIKGTPIKWCYEHGKEGKCKNCIAEVDGGGLILGPCYELKDTDCKGQCLIIDGHLYFQTHTNK